jgi:hypothetical protein
MPDQNNQTSGLDNDLSAQAHSDDPRQAIESGEPRIAGHQGTRVIEDEEASNKTDVDAKGRNPGEQQHWESGRQPAQ